MTLTTRLGGTARVHVGGVDIQVADVAEEDEELYGAILARAYGGDKPSPLDIYAAYEIASFEGFHLFGIDAFNDLIATEAGVRFSDEVRGGDNVETVSELKTDLHRAFKGAREAVLAHKLFKNRREVVDAFYAMHLSQERAGFLGTRWQFRRFLHEPFWAEKFEELQAKDPVSYDRLIGKPPEYAATIWERTLGDCAARHARGADVATGIKDHFGASGDWSTPMPGLDQKDTDMLNQMIEMLSFIDDGDVPGRVP